MTVTRPGSDSSMSDGPRIGWRDALVAGAPGGAGLAIWTDQSRNCVTLRLRGRLCVDTVRLLDTHVDLIGCQHSCDEVVLDLRHLEGMDEVGARLVVGFGHYVAGRGGRFTVEGAATTIGSMIARAEVELSS